MFRQKEYTDMNQEAVDKLICSKAVKVSFENTFYKAYRTKYQIQALLIHVTKEVCNVLHAHSHSQGQTLIEQFIIKQQAV